MHAFDEEQEATAPPPAVSFPRRRASGWLVSAAAAALVLIVAGGILATRDGDDDGGGDDAGGAAATEGTAEVVTDDEPQVAPGDTQPGGARTAADEEEGELAADTAADATAGAAATTGAPRTFGTEPASESAGQLPVAPDDLAEVARERLSSFEPASESRPTCDRGRFLGRVLFVVEGVETTTEVFFNRRDRTFLALDEQTCAVVATAPAP